MFSYNVNIIVYEFLKIKNDRYVKLDKSVIKLYYSIILFLGGVDMIPRKIKAIREHLGITELQVSGTICVNSYKYKRSEGDINYLSTEMLILLSIIYKVSLEKFLSEEYSTDDILEDKYLNSLKGLGKEQIEVVLKDNLCSYFSKKRKKANFATVNMILQNERKMFSVNLKNVIEQKHIDVFNISEAIGVTNSVYRNFETGATLPNPVQLGCLINYLDEPIGSLIMLKSTK